MAAIYDHDLIWRDDEHGMWTAMVPLLGRTFVARAIEVVEGDGYLEPAEKNEGTLYCWDAYRKACLDDTRHGLVTIGGLQCVVYLV